MAIRGDFRIGLDIGTNCLKMISYHKATTKKPELARIRFVDLISEEKVRHSADVSDVLILDTLTEWLDDLPYKKASVRLCLSSSESNLFVVTLPQVDMQELDKALFWELGPFLPQSVEYYEYTYQVLSLERNQLTILVGVYKKETLKRILKVFKKVGIRPDIIETDTLAVVDLFLTEFSELEESLGLLQLGANHSNYAILSPDSFPRFLFIPFGGNKLNDRIAKEKSLSFNQAEKLRRPPEQEGKPGSKRGLYRDDDRIVHGALEDLSKTIVRFNTHYQNKTGQRLSKIYLTGGLLNDQIVAETFELSPDFFQVPTEFWDPLGNYFPPELIEPRYSYHFTSALGLALR